MNRSIVSIKMHTNLNRTAFISPGFKILLKNVNILGYFNILILQQNTPPNSV